MKLEKLYYLFYYYFSLIDLRIKKKIVNKTLIILFELFYFI